jgi:hypothetical protein
MRILLAIILAFTLGIGSVAADTVIEYRGTRIVVTDDNIEAEMAKIDMLIDLGIGPPPAPPDCPFDEVKAPKAQTFKGDGSGGDAIQPEYDWTGQDYWLYT